MMSIELRRTWTSMSTGVEVAAKWSASLAAQRWNTGQASLMRQAEKAGDTPFLTARQCSSDGPVSTFTPPRNCTHSPGWMLHALAEASAGQLCTMLGKQCLDAQGRLERLVLH